MATIWYLPFIHTSPSGLSTIYTVLLRLVQIAEKLGQPHILLTADFAIYSKAQQIIWNKPASLEGKLTMRLGGMHLTMAYLASIRKLYADGGLLSFLVDCDVYAPVTARLMLQGKQLFRGVPVMKLVLEALFRLYYESLMKWQQQQDISKIDSEKLMKVVQDIQHAFEAKDKVSAEQLTEKLELQYGSKFQALQLAFNAAGRPESATFAYWETFMQGVDTLLKLLRAECDGLFELHLEAVCEVIPWCRAADRRNYAKYLPVYLGDMKALEEKHPKSFQ